MEISFVHQPALEDDLNHRRHRAAIVLGGLDEGVLQVAFDAESERMGFRHMPVLAALPAVRLRSPDLGGVADGVAGLASVGAGVCVRPHDAAAALPGKGTSVAAIPSAVADGSGEG